MGTKKSNKLYAAAAALAVTASAVAPGLSADAATKVTVKSVVNPASISHYGGYANSVKKLSLPKTVKVMLSNKKTENRSVKWGKVAYDAKYVGKYQTITGTVSGTSLKATIKVKLNNYPIDVVEPKLAPVAVGEEVKLPSTITVKYKDGKSIERSIKSFTISKADTSKAGKMKLSYSYKGLNLEIKGSIAYEVKAAEITNVMDSVKEDTLSVSADVKYPAKGAKAQLLIFAGKDESKGLAPIEGKIENGKFMAEGKMIPDGTHSYKIKVGDVVSAAKEFKVDVTAAVKEVKAINAKKVVVEFNKEMNETSAETVASYDFVGLTAGTTWTPELQADGKTVVLTLSNAIAADSTFVAIVNEVSTKADLNKKTEKFTKTINFSDTVKPTFTGVTYPEAGTAVLNFSEDLSTKGAVAIYDGSTDVTSSLTLTHVANSSKVTVSGLTTDKEYKVVVVGAKDQSSNLIPAPIEVLVKSSISEQIKPVIESVSSVDTTTLKIKFSEKLKQIASGIYANISVNGGSTVAGTTQTFDADTNTLTVAKTGLATAGVQSVSIADYKDLSNNTGDTLTKAVSFTLSAPVLEKTEVVKDATNTYVQLTFNEAPSLNAIQNVDIVGTYTTPENVLKAFAPGSLTEATDITLVGNTLKIKVTGNEAGKYKLTIPAAGISDGTTARTQDQVIEFALAASTDTSKPAVSNVYLPGENAAAISQGTVARNVVYVKYSKNMDASAVNVDNYMVDGQRLFDSAVFVGDKTLVKLTLKESGVTLSGDRSFQIATAVKGENGIAVDSFSSTESFVENVKPVLSSGIVVDGTKIDVTFTEALVDAQLVNANAGNDFEVYIDGVKSTLAAVDTGATANDSKIRLVLATGITPAQLSGSTITIKVLDTTDVTDSNLNPLTKGTVITLAK